MLVGQGTEAGSVLRPENYHLLGQNGGPVDITSVTYDATTRTSTLHFDTLPADFYTLIVETSRAERRRRRARPAVPEPASSSSPT